MRKMIFLLSAIIILGTGAFAYDYYIDDYGGVVEISKVFSVPLQNQLLQVYPEIQSLRNTSATTYIQCGSLSEYQCRKLGEKLDAVFTKICLDRNGIVSIEVNGASNIVRTVGDTSCLR